MLAKDLIALLQRVRPDTEVYALTSKQNLSSLLSVWEAYPDGRIVLQIVGVDEQPCEYYTVQYGEDDERGLPGPCNGDFFESDDE